MAHPLAIPPRTPYLVGMTTDPDTVKLYEDWLAKKAAGYDLNDPEDRAFYRGDVNGGLEMTKVSALRSVLAEMGATKIPVTRDAVCRALAETHIKKVTG